MPRMLYYLLLLAVIAPILSLAGVQNWRRPFFFFCAKPDSTGCADWSRHRGTRILCLVVAYKDHIELSMAIAAGSSIQVATFVAPLLVLISLHFATPLDLVFQPLELVVLTLATLLFAVVSWYGETTWLAGMQLIAVYVMACVVFFLLPK